MIATSVTLFTADAAGKWGNLGIQLGCIVVFMFLGHKFQDAIGIGGEHEVKDDHYKQQKLLEDQEAHHHDRH